jgi:hypothetical protein
MKTLAVLAAALAMAALPTMCKQNPGFKYKLTLSVETPEGVKSAYNVVEITHGTVVIVANGGTVTHARGEALYLDLGPGRRPLVALITHTYNASNPLGWAEVTPFNVLQKAYGEKHTDYGDNYEYLAKMVQYRGAKEIAPPDLPDLVTFADVNDPKSVMAVDANDLAATLGPGVKWKSITLEVTDEPLTSGIEKRLGWLTGLKNDRTHGDLLLDGQPYGHSGGDLANSLSWTNFIREGF